jgi:hypothetical protein
VGYRKASGLHCLLPPCECRPQCQPLQLQKFRSSDTHQVTCLAAAAASLLWHSRRLVATLRVWCVGAAVCTSGRLLGCLVAMLRVRLW